jgi:hypothetical protein
MICSSRDERGDRHVKIAHHDLMVDLNDEWWAEAGMHNFVPTARAYRSYRDTVEVRIAGIGPVDLQRQLVGIFRDNADMGISARERVLKILWGFRCGEAIPPVEIIEGRASYGYRYKLTDGVHRLYLSIAAGFTHVPTIKPRV